MSPVGPDYNRAEYLPERRAMMIHWASHLDAIFSRRISD
jgi:hypothetical protein